MLLRRKFVSYFLRKKITLIEDVYMQSRSHGHWKNSHVFVDLAA